MRLTRRDALAALGAAAGVGVGVDVATDGAVREAVVGEESGIDETTTETLVATATVVYPTAVTGVESFVARYTDGRLAAAPERRSAIRAAARELREAGEQFHGAKFAALSLERREETLRSLGVDTAEPVASGTLPERIRYYVVNDLLYALYASPTGGQLVGTPNPIGYPGGYQTALSDDNRRADPPEVRDPTEDVTDG